MELLLASGNPHKLREFQEILTPLGIQVISGSDIGGLPDVVEDGDTFEANAVKKALTVARTTSWWTIADDSGLVVDSLSGAPGVRSARFAGENADDQQNREKLLRMLGDSDKRSARFMCVVALANPMGLLGTASGSVEGHIAYAPRGDKGFGYDPLFIPVGHELTFAELSSETKHAMSHRGRALQAAVKQGLFEKFR